MTDLVDELNELNEIKETARSILIDRCFIPAHMLRENCTTFHISKDIYSAVSGVVGTSDPVCACKTQATFLSTPLCDIVPPPPPTPPGVRLIDDPQAEICVEEPIESRLRGML